MALGARRLLNLCYTLILDNPMYVFDPEAREKVVKMLSWDDEAEQRGAGQQDAQARRTAAVIGVNIDQQMDAVMRARFEAGVEQ